MKLRIFGIPLAGFALMLSACQPQNPPVPPPVPPAPVTNRVEITPGAALFTAAGQKRQLTAQLLNPQGSPIATPFQWTSSNPALVKVDANGALETLGNLGSAQITAEAQGVRSTVLVVVAQPVSGAVLVSDDQIVELPKLVGGGTPALGSRFQTTLKSVNPPAVGAMLIASEAKPLAGRVVSASSTATGVVVELEAVPLGLLFDALKIEESFDLAAAPLSFEGAVAPSEVIAQPGGGVLLRYRVQPGLRQQGEFELGPLKCTSSGNLQLSGSAFDVKLDNTLKVGFKPSLGAGHLLDSLTARVDGGFEATISGGVNLSLALAGSVKCKATISRLPIPITGFLTALITPSVPIGFGIEQSASLNLAGVSFRLEGSVEATVTEGFEYTRAGGFTNLSKAPEIKTEAAPKWNIPSQNDFSLNSTLDLYGEAGLDITLLSGIVNFGVLSARAGLRQELSLSFPTFQLSPETASNYALKLRGEIGPGDGLAKLFELLEGGPKIFNPSVSSEVLLSTSPSGTFTVDKTRARPGETVNFDVELDPLTLNYIPTRYNLTEVRIYRISDRDPVLKIFKTIPAADGQRSFKESWTPTQQDIGEYSFYAFVDTKLVPLIALEVDKDTLRRLSVGTQPKEWSGSVTYTISGNSSLTETTPANPPDYGPGSTTTTTTVSGGGSYKLVQNIQSGAFNYASATGKYIYNQVVNGTRVAYTQTSQGICTINGTDTSETGATGNTADNQGIAPFTVAQDGRTYSLVIGTLEGKATGTYRTSTQTQVSGPSGVCPKPINENFTNPFEGSFATHGFFINRPTDPTKPDTIEGTEVFEDQNAVPPTKYEITWKLNRQ
jgi:hypothetical protein